MVMRRCGVMDAGVGTFIGQDRRALLPLPSGTV
jgi:hypothetical protein